MIYDNIVDAILHEPSNCETSGFFVIGDSDFSKSVSTSIYVTKILISLFYKITTRGNLVAIDLSCL